MPMLARPFVGPHCLPFFFGTGMVGLDAMTSS